MLNADPMITTKIIAVCVSPNHKIENGTQQMLGNVWIPIISGLKFLCKKEKWLINIPITAPIISERMYPIAPRRILFPIAASNVPCFIISTKEFHTPTGDGIAYAFHIPSPSTPAT